MECLRASWSLVACRCSGAVNNKVIRLLVVWLLVLIGYKVIVNKLDLVMDKIRGSGMEKTSARALP